MRPFKFFFALSLGIVLFLFFARFVIFALLIAAAMSFIFYIGRRLKYFFRRLDWQEDAYYDRPFRRKYAKRRELPVWKDDLLVHYPGTEKDFIPNSRTIEIL